MIDDVRRRVEGWGLRLDLVGSDSDERLARTFNVPSRDRPDAIAFGFAQHLPRRRRIAQFALTHGLPTVTTAFEFAEAGALMAWDADLTEMMRRAASYVDKILKGTKPTDLPIEQATKVEFIVNLKTAKALGLTIPPSLLARADQVTE